MSTRKYHLCFLQLVDVIRVLQRAMDLYKKQKMEARGVPFMSKKTLDIVSESNQEKLAEQVHPDAEMAEEPVPTLDAEIADAANSKLDTEDVEAVLSVAAEVKLEVVSTSSSEVQNHISLRSQKLEVPDADGGQEYLGEPQAIPTEAKTEVIFSERVKSEDTNADGIFSPANASLSGAYLSTEGENINGVSKANDGQSIYNAEEGLAFGDGMSGPVFVPGESPKDCEAVMPGSNESESVNLSRIHHSPESTH